MSATFRERDLVLGAGAIKGFAHVGLIRAVEQWQIPIGDIVGVSMGSLVGVLYANGFSHEQITRILCKELHELELPKIINRLGVGKVGELMRRGGLFELESLFRDLVEKYRLAPQPFFKIIASTLMRRPAVFQGTDYDLAKALAASCAVPILFRPVRYNQQLLVDGGVYNPAPVRFCNKPAIVGRLGLARKMGKHSQWWLDRCLQGGEIFLNRFWERPAAKQPHVTVQAAPPDMATLTFSLSEKQYLEMVEYGYRATMSSLKDAERAGYL